MTAAGIWQQEQGEEVSLVESRMDCNNDCSKARRMYELLLECFQDVILNKGNYLSSV